jgi:hypothetical protein
MSIKIQQTYYEPIPTGKYPAKIGSIEEAEGQFGPQLKFSFELPPSQDGASRTLLGWCSKKFSQKSKLFTWTRAALGGAKIDRNYTFSSDDILGKRVLLTVIEEEGDSGIYNKITSVLPYNGQSKSTQPAPTESVPTSESQAQDLIVETVDLNEVGDW